MSDVCVQIMAVDRGMDVMDGYGEEMRNLQSTVSYEIESAVDLVEQEKRSIDQQIENMGYMDGDEEDLRDLYDISEKLGSFLYHTRLQGDELNEDWKSLCNHSIELTELGKRIMGEYIRKLNRIGGSENVSVMSSRGGSTGYRVVIVDSQKYPQTAEHIRMAQKMGFPEFVTLERTEAAQRRKESLADVRANPVYDRDEWPMAVFSEGGQGADVVYVDGHDNRGAGSYISWQMRDFPDGTRVRVRVI